MIRVEFAYSWVATLLGLSCVLAAEPPAKSDATKALAPVSYQLRNKKFGELLRPEEARSATGTPIVLYPAQAWKCMTWRFHAAGESAFQLQNHFTSKTFAADTKTEAAEAAVTQVPFSKEPGERPTWQFTRLPDGTYKIADAKSGKVLTAIKGDGGLKIVIGAWHKTDDQKWEMQEIDPKQLTM
jgi:hypothetical protein